MKATFQRSVRWATPQPSVQLVSARSQAGIQESNDGQPPMISEEPAPSTSSSMKKSKSDTLLRRVRTRSINEQTDQPPRKISRLDGSAEWAQEQRRRWVPAMDRGRRLRLPSDAVDLPLEEAAFKLQAELQRLQREGGDRYLQPPPQQRTLLESSAGRGSLSTGDLQSCVHDLKTAAESVIASVQRDIEAAITTHVPTLAISTGRQRLPRMEKIAEQTEPANSDVPETSVATALQRSTSVFFGLADQVESSSPQSAVDAHNSVERPDNEGMGERDHEDDEESDETFVLRTIEEERQKRLSSATNLMPAGAFLHRLQVENPKETSSSGPRFPSISPKPLVSSDGPVAPSSFLDKGTITTEVKKGPAPPPPLLSQQPRDRLSFEKWIPGRVCPTPGTLSQTFKSGEAQRAPSRRQRTSSQSIDIPSKTKRSAFEAYSSACLSLSLLPAHEHSSPVTDGKQMNSIRQNVEQVLAVEQEDSREDDGSLQFELEL